METLEKIFVNRDLCDGCLDCEHACESIHECSRINMLESDSSYYPILCQQCEDAPCAKICPSEAMSSTGVDSDKCIVCGLCSMVCPFGAITITPTTAEKCNRCVDREEGPACIKACSKRAISLVDPEKMKEKHQANYLAKLSGKSKTRKNSFINVVTSGTRANKAFND